MTMQEWDGLFNLRARSEQRLVQLWRRFKGLCHWCRRPTFLYPLETKLGTPGRTAPMDQATRDHLYSRFDARRQSGDTSNVLACWQCNHERGIKSETAYREGRLRFPTLPPVINDPRDQPCST